MPAEHTPGPWEARDRGHGYSVVGQGMTVAWCSTATVAGTISGSILLPEAEANARLIAAAPAMLRLLREIHGDAVDEHGKTVTYPENGEDDWLERRDALLAELETK